MLLFRNTSGAVTQPVCVISGVQQRDAQMSLMGGSVLKRYRALHAL